MVSILPLEFWSYQQSTTRSPNDSSTAIVEREYETKIPLYSYESYEPQDEVEPLRKVDLRVMMK
jgi:hypothetical protein